MDCLRVYIILKNVGQRIDKLEINGDNTVTLLSFRIIYSPRSRKSTEAFNNQCMHFHTVPFTDVFSFLLRNVFVLNVLPLQQIGHFRVPKPSLSK